MNDDIYISTCCSTLFRFLTFTPICVIDFMTTMRVFTMVYECLVDKWMWLKVKEMGNSNTEEGVRGTGDSKVKCAVISAKLLFSKQANLITDITKRNGLSEEIPDFFPCAILFWPIPWRPLVISSKTYQNIMSQICNYWNFREILLAIQSWMSCKVLMGIVTEKRICNLSPLLTQHNPSHHNLE